MRPMAQIAMVMNLDKCIGCHTCSVTCKQAWTNRRGMEYVWFNNVETRPGQGYPRRYEDQEHWQGGWAVNRRGALSTAAMYTGHAVLTVRDGAVTHREIESASTTVYFGSPTDSDLDAYISSGEPLRVAGGFTIDGLGGWFIDRIEGDPSNVIGLSLPLMRQLLTRAGLSIGGLWTDNSWGCQGRD